MIRGGTLEVRVVALLILEEEATAAAVVAAAAAVQSTAQANLLRLNPHNVHQLNRQLDQFLVLAQDLDPVLYQDMEIAAYWKLEFRDLVGFGSIACNSICCGGMIFFRWATLDTLIVHLF
jgi:hypothetical protein